MLHAKQHYDKVNHVRQTYKLTKGANNENIEAI